jgi:phosphate transport system substrate-binding protein
VKRMRSLAAVVAVLGVAALTLTAWTGLAGASSKKASLSGAGSTFVAPLVAQWTAHYSVACHGCVQIPWAFAATSIPYNVSGVGYGLKLTGPILAQIFMGKITKWNDSRIRAINKGVSLPSEDIVPIHRSDGSGTSFNFTDYLSHVSKTWKSQIGKSTSPAWPSGVGVGAKGSSGVAAKLGSTPGGITYVDVAYAYKSHYKIAKLKNRAGRFVLPSVRSLNAVSAQVKSVPKNNAISVVDPPKKVAKGYPICTFTWVIVPLKTSRAADLKHFIDWAVTKGQTYGHPLLFLPIPKVVRTAARKTTARLHT